MYIYIASLKTLFEKPLRKTSIRGKEYNVYKFFRNVLFYLLDYSDVRIVCFREVLPLIWTLL
jgi:hypothetical protein